MKKGSVRKLFYILLIILLVLFILTVVWAALIPTIKKPAIYLYPVEDGIVDVSVLVNGKLTKTIPEYGDGWRVFATKEGIINGKYDYLFYEAGLDKLEFPEKGWVIEYENLEKWFDINLIKLGLNEKEKNQFEEYWLKELPRANYYEIKLLDKEFLKQNIDLAINPEPDTLIRINFYFKPLKEKIILDEPEIVSPQRKGFTVVEWGGILA